ncbi:PPE domain-containing protein [Nocardia sp. NBC_01329]|uniref:PPE domain-containing protein n=1 Tax=Nocardia sp. NBC_01329 TaxID=2903594 RepID=UPI002E0EA8CE|nr:PPE domain-containing protein [Nocardia sp. NBC_01329]
MIEPPVPGFTGVIWEARPAEKLAHDLGTGPGGRPMTEAGAAWSELAAAFGTAVVEYDRIMARMRDSWRSTESGPAIDRFATLRHWLVDAAAAAGRNASLAGGQAVAYEVARLAMPHMAEIAALTAAIQSLEQIGAALGAPLVAAVAEVDTEQNLAKANAARVMQGYESASASLALPWEQVHPPEIVSDAALEAERSAAPPAPGTPKGMPVMTSGVSFGVPRMPRPLTRYQPRALAPVSAAAPETAPVQSSPAAQSDSGRMAPGGMAPSAGAAGGDRAVRAGIGDSDAAEVMEIDAGIQVAPAVLGAAEPPQYAVPGSS